MNDIRRRESYAMQLLLVSLRQHLAVVEIWTLDITITKSSLASPLFPEISFLFGVCVMMHLFSFQFFSLLCIVGLTYTKALISLVHMGSPDRLLLLWLLFYFMFISFVFFGWVGSVLMYALFYCLTFFACFMVHIHYHLRL